MTADRNLALVDRLPPLADREVHAVVVDLDASDDSFRILWSSLSSAERDRADRFRHADDRTRFILAHGWLRRILGHYLETSPERIEFDEEANGKPKVASNGTNLQFNLSHAHDTAVVVVAREVRVGVDIENVRPIADLEQLVSRCFSAGEQLDFNRLPASERERAFLRGWTRKEACLKAIGTGLSIALESFEVPLTSDDPPEPARIATSPHETTLLWLKNLSARESVIGSIAVEGPDWQLRCF